jgi:hypothetical protein
MKISFSFKLPWFVYFFFGCICAFAVSVTYSNSYDLKAIALEEAYWLNKDKNGLTTVPFQVISENQKDSILYVDLTEDQLSSLKSLYRQGKEVAILTSSNQEDWRYHWSQ